MCLPGARDQQIAGLAREPAAEFLSSDIIAITLLELAPDGRYVKDAQNMRRALQLEAPARPNWSPGTARECLLDHVVCPR